MKKINSEAFCGCYEIGGYFHSLRFPHNIKEIATSSFDKTFLGRVQIYDETKVDNAAFDSCTSIAIEINRDSTTFETDRLIIRPLNESDYETTKAYTCNKDNTRLMIYQSMIDDKSFDDHFDIIMSQFRAEIVVLFHFAVCLKDSGIHIGEIFIDTLGNDSYIVTKINIGWIIVPEHRNKGYCTEAAGAVINWAKEHLHITMVKAKCDIENIASKKVMEKLGMELENTTPRTYSDGRKSEELHYYLELLDNE